MILQGGTNMYRIAPYKTRRNEVSNLFNLFDDILSDFPNDATYNDAFKVDIQDNETNYIFEAELPGVSKEDVLVDYKNDKLMIQVKKEEETEDEGKNYIRKERKSASMQRAFFLKKIDSKGITAKLDSGILTINVPKIIEEDNSFKVDIQ